jgi:hypothetical protein
MMGANLILPISMKASSTFKLISRLALFALSSAILVGCNNEPSKHLELETLANVFATAKGASNYFQGIFDYADLSIKHSIEWHNDLPHRVIFFGRAFDAGLRGPEIEDVGVKWHSLPGQQKAMRCTIVTDLIVVTDLL